MIGRLRRWRNDRYRRRHGWDDSSGSWRRVAAVVSVAAVAGACSSGGGSRVGEVARVVVGTSSTTSTSTTQPPAPPSVTAVTRSEPSGRGRPRSASPRSAPSSDAWGCIRKYESGGTTDPAGSNEPGGGYYQIIPSTWDAQDGKKGNGYRGYARAEDAPYDVQTETAHKIQRESGWGQWSTARRCGLL